MFQAPVCCAGACREHFVSHVPTTSSLVVYLQTMASPPPIVSCSIFNTHWWGGGKTTAKRVQLNDSILGFLYHTFQIHWGSASGEDKKIPWGFPGGAESLSFAFVLLQLSSQCGDKQLYSTLALMNIEKYLGWVSARDQL